MKTKHTTNTLSLGLLNSILPENIWNSPYMYPETSIGSSIQTGDTVRFNETAEEFVVEIDLPGVKKADTELNIANYYVHISAKREIITQGGKRQETITRSFKLNSEADIDNIKAIQENGVLTITAKRKNIEKNKIRKIEIK
jgi:HSP20 family protein